MQSSRRNNTNDRTGDKHVLNSCGTNIFDSVFFFFFLITQYTQRNENIKELDPQLPWE